MKKLISLLLAAVFMLSMFALADVSKDAYERFTR